jgi:hypothetical protein
VLLDAASHDLRDAVVVFYANAMCIASEVHALPPSPGCGGVEACAQEDSNY